MKPDVRGAMLTPRPETARVVRAAVVERLVGSGMSRERATVEAERSYRRVETMIERAQRAKE